MTRISVEDRPLLERYLRTNPSLYLYHLGDLDDFFYPHTTWYAWEEGGKISAVILVYTAFNEPVVLALNDHLNITAMRRLLDSLSPSLPPRAYFHISPALEPLLSQSYRHLHHHGLHHKMALQRPDCIPIQQPTGVIQLSTSDAQDLTALYTEAYPDHAFDPKMLETGQFYGIRQDGELVSAAGIHVFSQAYRVAALGNVTTLPTHRGRGFARQAVKALCQNLLPQTDIIGLNVKADNTPAIQLYQSLGFEITDHYVEITAST